MEWKVWKRKSKYKDISNLKIVCIDIQIFEIYPTVSVFFLSGTVSVFSLLKKDKMPLEIGLHVGHRCSYL